MNMKTSNPYIGPRTFQEHERDRFFGRDREARELLSLIVSEQIVLFYAQSGAGKSSLVNTSLTYEMKKRGFDILFGRVGGDAPAGFEVDNIFSFNLMRSLVLENVDLDLLAHQPLSDFFSTKDARNKIKLREDCVLVIDQFEELFSTHNEEWEKRGEFLRQLAMLLEGGTNFKILLVMREDYIALLDPYAYLIPGKLRMRYYMQQLGVGAALKAVSKPVISGDFSRPYAEGVAEKLVDDIRSIPSKRPDGKTEIRLGQFVEPLFLQVICYNVWESIKSIDDPEITFSDLKKVGDVNEFLKNYYAWRVAAVAELEHVSERKIRRWFEEELISSTGIRNMVLQEPGGVSGGLENRVIAALSDLVRTDQRGGTIFYELTHDRLVSLILTNNKNWEEKNNSLVQKQAAVWAKNGYKNGWLLTSQTLGEAEAWAKQNIGELTRVEADFLEASKKRRTAQRRNWLLVVLSFVFAFVGLFVFSKVRQKAEDEVKKLAVIAQANSLSKIAVDTSDRQLDLSILLGLEAHKSSPNSETESALLTLLQKAGSLQGYSVIEKDARDVQFLSDQQKVVVLGKDGMKILDLSGNLLELPFWGIPSSAYSTAFDPTGNILASSSKAGGIILWNVKTGERFGPSLEGHTDWVNRVMFSADGNTLMSAGDDARIGLWNVQDPSNPKRLRLLQLNYGVNDAVLSSRDVLAVTDTNGNIYLWDINEIKDVITPRLTACSTIIQTAFSPDGGLLAYGDTCGQVHLADVSDPLNPKELSSATLESGYGVFSVTFSPNGRVVAVGDEGGGITIYYVLKPSEPYLYLLATLNEHEDVVHGLVFSRNNEILISGGEDGEVIFWDWAKQKKIISWPSSDATGREAVSVNSVTLDPTSSKLSVGLENGTIQVLDVSKMANPEKLESLPGDRSAPSRMEISPDGRYLTLFSLVPTFTGDNEVPVIFDLANNKQIDTGRIVFQPSSGPLIIEEYDAATELTQIKFFDPSDGLSVNKPIMGKFLAITSNNRILAYETNENYISLIHLMDLQNGEEIGSPIQGSFIAFNGNALAYAVFDVNGYQVYDEGGNSLLGLLNLNNAEHTEVAGNFIGLRPDGQLLFSRRSTLEAPLQIMAVRVGDSEPQELFSGNFVNAPVLSEDKKFMAFVVNDAGGAGYEFQVFDIVSEELLPVSNINNAAIVPYILRLSANGRILIFSSVDSNGASKVLAFDTTLGTILDESFSSELQKFFENAPSLVYEIYDYTSGSNVIVWIDTSKSSYRKVTGKFVRFVNDGKVLVYSEDNGIHFLDLVSGKDLGSSIQGTYLGMSMDEGILFTWDGDKILRWDSTKTWPLGDPLSEITIPSGTTAINQDGNKTAWVDADGIHWMDVASSHTTTHGPFNAHRTNQITGNILVFSPDGTVLVAYDQNLYTGSILDLEAGDTIAENISIGSAIFSPNGKFLAIIDNNAATVSVWDIETRMLILESASGTNPVFNPSGRQLAVTDYTLGVTSVWDLESKQKIFAGISGINPIFDAKGDKLAVQQTVIAKDGTVSTTTSVWDLNLKKVIFTELPSIYSPIFSKSGGFLVLVDGTYTAKVWDMNTGEEVSIGPALEVPVLSPDGSLLLLSDYSNITVWELKAGRKVFGTVGVYPVFSRDGGKLAYVVNGITDSIVRVWDVREKKELENQFPGSNPVFSPDGRILAVGNPYTYKTDVWDLETGDILAEKIIGTTPVFNTNGSTLVVEDYNTTNLTIWDVASRKIIGSRVAGSSPVFSPDGRMIAFYSGRTVSVWSLEKGQELVSGLPGGDLIVFSADSRALAIGISYYSASTLVWDLENNKEAAKSLSGFVPTFSPNGKILAIADYSKISIWNTENLAERVEPLRLIPTLPSKLVFSSDGTTLASTAADEIILWDMKGDAIKPRFDTPWVVDGYTGSFYGMAFYSENKRLAALRDNGTLVTWEVASGSITVPEEQPPNLDVTRAFTFSPDGDYLIYDSGDGAPMVWDVVQGQAKATSESFPMIENFVKAISFSSDGSVMGYSDGGKVILYKFPQLEKISELSTGFDSIIQFGIIMDGSKIKYLITRDGLDTTQIWDWETRTKTGEPMSGELNLIGSNVEDKSFMYIDSTGRLVRVFWGLSHEDWQHRLCPLAGRNLTPEEWETYLPTQREEDRTVTCSDSSMGK